MKTITPAILAALLRPISAEAAVTATNYSFSATFDTSRPVQLIEGLLSTSYDDQTRKLSLAEFYVDVNDKSFYLNQVGAFGPNTQLGIGGIAFDGPENLASDSEDFIAAFSVANGRLTALTSFAYSYNGSADVGAANSLMTTLAIIPDEVEDLPVAVVPEPATWAMMLVGFGMVGATARYRRRGAKVIYA